MQISTRLQTTLTPEPKALLPEPLELATDPLAGVTGYRVQTDLQAGICPAGCTKTADGRCLCGAEGNG